MVWYEKTFSCIDGNCYWNWWEKTFFFAAVVVVFLVIAFSKHEMIGVKKWFVNYFEYIFRTSLRIVYTAIVFKALFEDIWIAYLYNRPAGIFLFLFFVFINRTTGLMIWNAHAYWIGTVMFCKIKNWSLTLMFWCRLIDVHFYRLSSGRFEEFCQFCLMLSGLFLPLVCCCMMFWLFWRWLKILSDDCLLLGACCLFSHACNEMEKLLWFCIWHLNVLVHWVLQEYMADKYPSFCKPVLRSFRGMVPKLSG